MSQIEIVLESLANYTSYAPLAVIGYWLQQTRFLEPV